MMLKERELQQVHELNVELIPQAIIGMRIDDIVNGKASLVQRRDDLDDFRGASFTCGKLKFAVRHYAGHPSDTATIYIDRKYRDVTEITSIVEQILNTLKIPRKALKWQRADDPDL